MRTHDCGRNTAGQKNEVMNTVKAIQTAKYAKQKSVGALLRQGHNRSRTRGSDFAYFAVSLAQ